MRFGIIVSPFLIFFFLSPMFAFAWPKADSAAQMTLFEARIGMNYQYSQSKNTLGGPLYRYNMTGLSGKIQLSFLDHFFLTDKNKKFRIRDVFAAEAGVGSLYADNSSTTSLWTPFFFDLGIATITHINRHNDFGVNLIILKFGQDQVSPFLVGSNITLRYRHKAWLTEAAMEARNNRTLGWIPSPGQAKALQFRFSLRYLMKNGLNTGIQGEWFSDYLTGNIDDGNQYQNYRITLFFGRYR